MGDEMEKVIALNIEELLKASFIILLHNFLSMEECDYLRAVALPRLKSSTVVDAKTGKELATAGATKRPTCCVLVMTKPTKGDLEQGEQEKLKVRL
ncbi:hypothetical protein RIF29_38326 [Crotalaria pallida]|uniref:Uncharacterized protein n=1 Tax=Crotalaria pallida TaxID=3830 RepID=A0AAN9HPL4_CROPI